MDKLLFLSNIPTPYNFDFIESLEKEFELSVVFFAKAETVNGKLYDYTRFMSKQNSNYLILSDSILVRPILRKYPSFHFSWSIFRVLFKHRGSNILLGGFYLAPNAIAALMLGKIFGSRIAYFTESLFETRAFFKRLLKHLSLIPLKLFCDDLLVTGDDAAESFRSFGFKKSIHHLPYNIDSSKYLEENLNKERIKGYSSILDIEDKFVFLSSGALIQRKGFDILIEAFLNLPYENRLRSKLLILGSGEELRSLEILVQDGDDDIVFAGMRPKEELPYYYNVADAFIFPTRYDGWGVVINEAIAANIPIVSSYYCGAARTLINSGVNGIVLKSLDSIDYTNAMLDLMNDLELYNKLKKNSLDLISSIDSTQSALKLKVIFASN